MKKIIFLVVCVLLLAGCGKYNEKDAFKDLQEKIGNLKSYKLNGELLIYRGEDSYTYDVEVAYQEKDFYRVSLVNKINNHEQIILRNTDGVYVLTPSLNKSFKFQSDWPYNNSQIYLLERVLADLEKDSNRVLEKNGNNYVFTSAVKYSNNENLVKQKVYVDKDSNINKIEILNTHDTVEMSMTFSKIDEKASFDEKYFALENNMKDAKTETTSQELDSIVYPMYIPVNTYLTSQDKVSLDSGERIILMFDGDSPFMLVEETVSVGSTLDTNIVYGDPHLIGDTVGAITDYSVSWISNGVEYYLVSDNMDALEMINVAQSITVSANIK